MSNHLNKSGWLSAILLAAAVVPSSLSAETFDFTRFIKNNSFESDFESWTRTDMQVQSNTSFPLKEGRNYIEKWVSTSNTSGVGSCSVIQDLTDLVPGTYTLTVAAQNIRQDSDAPQTGAAIFVGGRQTTVTAPADYTVVFSIGNLGNAKIGFRATNASGNYIAVDNFRLHLTQLASNLDPYIEKISTRVDELLAQKLEAKTAETLRTNIAKVKEAHAASDTTTFVNSTLTLIDAIETAQSSATAYASLKTAIDKLDAAYTKTTKQADAADNLALLEQAKTVYENAAYSVAQIEALLTRMNKVIDHLTEIIDAFSKLQTSLTIVEREYATIVGKPGSEDVKAVIDEARKMIDEGTASAEEALAMKARVDNAMLLYKVATTTGKAPTVKTNTNIVRGATFALGRSTVTPVPGVTNIEVGFCWSTNPNPTIADNRTTKSYTHNGTIFHITDLEPSTIYYVRAYAITREYAVGYGDVVKVVTIPRGTATWSYNPNDGDDATNNRIRNATESALYYINTCTSLSNWHTTVNYSPGTPTADCSYGGWIRVGSNTSYQRTGTLLHEINHGVGVGQTVQWYGPNSPWRAEGTRGAWLGERANNVVRFFENNPSSTLNGDNTHMWPYGVNGAHEDTGEELLYMANALIDQGLFEDGLPPVANEFHKPCYFFPSEDGVKYYLRIEDANVNKTESYIVEDELHKVQYKAMSLSEALNDDNAAWYITFDPVSCYYRFQNVASGQYLVTNRQMTSAAQTSATPSETLNPDFQLTGSIAKAKLGNDLRTTYWISSSYTSSTPLSLAYSLNTKKMSYAAFTTAANGPRQRWHIFSADELAETAIDDIQADSQEAAKKNPDVYDLSGRLVRANAADLDGLAPGFYIVGSEKVFVK